MTVPTQNLPLDAGRDGTAVWAQIAQRCAAWMASQGLAPRDCIVLLPFAQHLPLARRAWMAQGGWPPRLETTATLALSLGPEPLAQAGDISFDGAIDQLTAIQLLKDQRWAQTWRAEDARGFDLAVTRLVEAAHAWAKGAAQRHPDERPAYWAAARLALDSQGPGETERLLARVALEWAASGATQPASDALFALRPAGLVVVQAGGADPLSMNLMKALADAGGQVLLLDTDLALEGLFADAPPSVALQLALCGDFEDEAASTAAAVLAHVNQGQVPVALIAQDRLLLRRVRALLERAGVALADETGWTLSTLPSATQLMAWLRASRHAATLDEVLDALKTDLAQQLDGTRTAFSLQQLEAQCRNRGWTRIDAVNPALLSPEAAAFWAASLQALKSLQHSARRPLSQWLQALSACLQGLNAWSALSQLLGGPEVVAALSLQQMAWPGSAQEAALRDSLMSQAEFLAWVDHSLESRQYVPPPGPNLPQVHITPLVRAILRPFAAIVLPGADAQTLGAPSNGTGVNSLIGEALATQLGLPTLAERRHAQGLAFAQLLRAPHVTLLRRRSDGAEPLSPSPLLEQLQRALHEAGLPNIPAWTEARQTQTLAVQAVPRSAVQAAGRLPQGLSASSVESLRNCPYQFFSRVLLGLRESDELGDEVDKRDYGTWLHGVLFDFHRWRMERPGADDAVLLQEAAQAQARELGLDAAAFLPFSSSFERFVPRYLDWLKRHEAGGAMWAEGELSRELKPEAWQGTALAEVVLRGRLDRVDVLSSAEGTGLFLIDYKTGNSKGLKDKMDPEPLEDTQLAVYAALMSGQGLDGMEDADTLPLRAAYLALEDSKGIQQIEHPEVADTAQRLLDGLGHDLLALHAGHALPALGEGMVCEHCEMRGLCRRDDWAQSVKQDPATQDEAA